MDWETLVVVGGLKELGVGLGKVSVYCERDEVGRSRCGRGGCTFSKDSTTLARVFYQLSYISNHVPGTVTYSCPHELPHEWRTCQVVAP